MSWRRSFLGCLVGSGRWSACSTSSTFRFSRSLTCWASRPGRSSQPWPMPDEVLRPTWPERRAADGHRRDFARLATLGASQGPALEHPAGQLWKTTHRRGSGGRGSFLWRLRGRRRDHLRDHQPAGATTGGRQVPAGQTTHPSLVTSPAEGIDSTSPHPSSTVTAPPAAACFFSAASSLGTAGPAMGTGSFKSFLQNVSGQRCYLGGVFPLQGVTASGTARVWSFRAIRPPPIRARSCQEMWHPVALGPSGFRHS